MATLVSRPRRASPDRRAIRYALAVAASLVVFAMWAASSSAQGAARPARWEVSVGIDVSTPSGWVQVRENEIAGTRLDLRRDLGVVRTHAIDLDVGYHIGGVSIVRLTVESNALDGRAILARDVSFNGTTLAGGTVLETRTHFPYFVRATAAAERCLIRIGSHGCLAGLAGLTFVMLTVQLRGTIAPGSIGRETKEDFVTQELPVPLLGLRLDYPLVHRFALRAALDGGDLPWVNSLRPEGGELRLTQRHLDVDAALDYGIAPALRIEGGYRYRYFVQRESSREDGNDVLLREHGVRLGLRYAF